MKEIEVRANSSRPDPQGKPQVVLKIDGRLALFAKQIASTFEGSTMGRHLIDRLRHSGLYEEDRDWRILTYHELMEIQRQEKIASGNSAVESLLAPINPNGAAIIFEEAALWLLARSNSQNGKEFAKMLVETFIAVREGEYIPLGDLKRIEARKKLTDTEKKFARIIYERGVDGKGIAEIRAVGDEALFGGYSTEQMKKKVGCDEDRPLADFLSTVVIKAKDLATEMTAVNTQDKNLRGKTPIKKEHIDNNAAIRNTLGARGIKPELMPPEEDIKKLERRINKEAKKKLAGAKPILLDKPLDEAA